MSDTLSLGVYRISKIFTESTFPSAFGNAAMESYMESQVSYGSLFEDKSKYDAVMSGLA